MFSQIAASPIWYENFEQKGAAYTPVFTVTKMFTIGGNVYDWWWKQHEHCCINVGLSDNFLFVIMEIINYYSPKWR